MQNNQTTPHRLYIYALALLAFALTTSRSALAQSEDTQDPSKSEYILNHPIRTTYIRYCASCHGQFLQGGSGSSFIDKKWEADKDEDYIKRSIDKGILNKGMPPFGAILNDEQIRQLASYIKNAPAELQTPKHGLPGKITTRDYEVKLEVIVDGGMEEPWSIAFVDENRALVTDKIGKLYWLIDGKLDPNPIQGTPAVRYASQGGLLDVNIDPNYGDDENDWVYLAFSHSEDGSVEAPGMTKIVRGKIVNGQWTDEQTLFEARKQDYRDARHHYGSRIVFDKNGYLYFSIGDRGTGDDAQRLDKPNGKIHRINPDGSIPSDNPFVNQSGNVYPSIYSYGHRNPQGLAIHPDTNELWITEHGPKGGDELNLIKPGHNYGWPVITYGINYNGTIITDEFKKQGMDQPVLYWVPSIAACAWMHTTTAPSPAGKATSSPAALAHEELRRLVLDNDRVIHQEVILKDLGRIRDVACAPDGSIYILFNRPRADRKTKLPESRCRAMIKRSLKKTTTGTFT